MPNISASAMEAIFSDGISFILCHPFTFNLHQLGNCSKLFSFGQYHNLLSNQHQSKRLTTICLTCPQVISLIFWLENIQTFCFCTENILVSTTLKELLSSVSDNLKMCSQELVISFGSFRHLISTIFLSVGNRRWKKHHH